MQLIDTTSISSEAPDFNDVIVNGTTIDPHNILQEMQYYPAESMELSRQQAAQSLVVRELLWQRVQELGLAEEGDTADNESLISVLLEKEVTLPTADEESCLCYYNANKERFKTPVLIAASHILLGADPKDLEDRDKKKELAERLLDVLAQAPDKFAELASEYSDCPSKELGGQLGQLDKGQTVAEFERQVFAHDVGLMKYPVESRYGFHITKVDQRVEGEQLPFEAVEEKIRLYLQEHNYRRAVNQYIQLLAGDADISGIDIVGADSLLVQ
jgi:peptidyl-prolyl cis-trans isomerase C